VTEKITPETYEKMNEEFEEEGMAFRIIVPTQEEIDNWRGKEECKYQFILTAVKSVREHRLF